MTRRVVKRPDFPPERLRLSQKVVKWARAEYEAWKANHYNRGYSLSDIKRAKALRGA